MRKLDLKKATEGAIMAAQEQAIRTRPTRDCIDKENISPMCRLCGGRDETVAHLVSGYFVRHSTRSSVMTKLSKLFIGSYVKLMTRIHVKVVVK